MKSLILIVLVLFGLDVSAQDFWISLDGPRDTAGFVSYASAIYTPKNNKLFAVGQSRLLRSTDNGVSWILASDDLRYRQILELAEAPNGTLYATGYMGFNYVSTDGGSSWQLMQGLDGKFITRIYPMPNSDVFVCVNNGGVWKTTDNGVTWIEKNNGIPAGHWGQGFTRLDNGDLLVSTGLNGVYGVYRSSDNGESWTLSNTGVETVYLWTLLTARNGVVIGGGMNKGIYRSTDNGHTWVSSSTGITDSTKSDPQNVFIDGSGIIYANCGYGKGAHRSLDNGATWENISSGMKYKDHGKFTVDNDGYLYVGSGFGIYRANEKVVPIMSAKNIVDGKYISAYPNPASDYITVPAQSPATVTLFDCIGKKVLQQTIHSEPIDVRSLPNGVYQMRVIEGEATSSFSIIVDR